MWHAALVCARVTMLQTAVTSSSNFCSSSSSSLKYGLDCEDCLSCVPAGSAAGVACTASAAPKCCQSAQDVTIQPTRIRNSCQHGKARGAAASPSLSDSTGVAAAARRLRPLLDLAMLRQLKLEIVSIGSWQSCDQDRVQQVGCSTAVQICKQLRPQVNAGVA